MFAGVGEDVVGDAQAGDGDGFGAEALGEAEAGGYAGAFGLAGAGGGGGFDVEHGPGRAHAVGQAAAVAHQGLAAGAALEADQDAFAGLPGAGDGVGLHMVAQLDVDALGGAAQREFAERGEIADGEVVGQRAFGGFGEVDAAFAEALQEVFGGDVDELDGVGAVDQAVGDGFADADAGDAGDDVVEAFEVLDVERGPDVDAGVEQLGDVHVALGVAAAGGVGVGEFVDEGEGGAAGEEGVEVHLLEGVAAVGDGAAGDGFEAFGEGGGFAAAVGFDDADDDLAAGALVGAGGGEHGPGFADAWGGAEEDLEAAARSFAIDPAQSFAGDFAQEGVGGAAGVGHRLSAGVAVEGQVDVEDVHPRFAPEAEEAGLDVAFDDGADAGLGEAAGAGDAGDLEAGGFGGDFGVEAAGRRGDEVGGDGERGVGVFGAQAGDVGGDAGGEGLGGGAEVGAGGVGGVVGGGDGFGGVGGVGGGGGRGAALEVARAGEGLADEGGADHLAVAGEQAAVGLGGEEGLGEAGDRQRVGEPGEQGHRGDHREGGTQMGEHGHSPYASPRAETSRSMSLMPAKGATRPPAP